MFTTCDNRDETTSLCAHHVFARIIVITKLEHYISIAQ